MIVVSDTSSLSALLRVGHLSLLKSLFGKVTVPVKVAEELAQLEYFGVDLSEFSNADWIDVKHPSDLPLLNRLLLELDEGEAQAITIAVELAADWLIIDELKGRNVAASLSINFVGLAGVLLLAKDAGVLPAIKPMMDRILKETSFRISKKLQEYILKTAGE